MMSDALYAHSRDLWWRAVELKRASLDSPDPNAALAAASYEQNAWNNLMAVPRHGVPAIEWDREAQARELAQKVVQSKFWDWLPGMKKLGDYPDFSDRSTVAALLPLARQAHGKPGLNAFQRHANLWWVQDQGGSYVTISRGETELEALVNAILEAK